MSEQANETSMPEAEAEDNFTGGSALSGGQQLAAARDAHGWSVEQVAARLKMAPRQIEALETDHWDALPGAVVARGFIRTYARLLNVDPAPLLATMVADVPSPIESIQRQGRLSTRFSETRLPSMHAHPAAAPRWITGGVFVLLVVAVGTWGLSGGSWLSVLPEQLLAVIGQQPMGPEAVSSTAVVEAAVVNDAPSLRMADPAPTIDSVQRVGANQVELQTTAVNQVSMTPLPVAAEQKKNNLLSLALHQDSWVEIKREDGTVLLSRLAQAGTTETFEVTEPISLVVGNVAGVDATLRDAPLDLKSATGTNVARVNLK